MAQAERVVIVGAGLVGSLAAIFLARRGLDVTVHERFHDIRQSPVSGGRSINLVLTHRGLEALARVGLDEGAQELTVRVLGRVIHDLGGTLAYQPYGKDDSECNYSISRRELNRFLIKQAERHGVRFVFNSRLVETQIDSGYLLFQDEIHGKQGKEIAQIILGADGAASSLRAALVRDGRCKEDAVLMDHGYKELLIPVEQGVGLDQHALHIWPRGEMMFMALPNLDGSFTGTLYLPFEGAEGFAELDSERRLLAFFERHFPSAIPLIPGLVDEFFSNPTGNLGTVKCFPWHYADRALLIGDAAHAIVPFFGQGMNCGFEDCIVLEEEMNRIGGRDWAAIFEAFATRRKPNADAIADMALENFIEMSERVGDPQFRLRKQVEHRLEQTMPQQYRSRYSMVMYSRIPYRLAFEAGEIQRRILDRLCESIEAVDELDIDLARRLIQEQLTPFLTREGVALDY